VTVLIILFFIWWFFELIFKIPLVPFLKENNDRLTELVSRNYFSALFFFSIVYAFFTFLCFPGSSLFMITAGFLFGPFVSPLLIIFSATFGGTFLLIALRAGLTSLHARLTNLHPAVTLIIKEFDRQGILYLLILRLTGFIPVSVTNVAMSFTPKKFFIISLLGMIPIAMSYTFVGVSAAQIAQQQAGAAFSLQLAGILFLLSKGLAVFLLFIRYFFIKSSHSV
jgi:uncharacterized membrane protein YdjX (TVP38/TMEM64 family)